MATNVAAATNGGVASASSTINSSYLPGNANDGDRTGIAYWNDGSPSGFDDWFEVDFSGSFTINEIDVFSIQDNYGSPITPTLSMVCGLYGLRDFEVQYWSGSAWVTVTGGSVSGNANVWRQFTFVAVTTTKIRVLVHASQDGLYSRIAEVEAWTSSAPTAATTPDPIDGATSVPTMPILSWSAGGATTYDVKLDTSNPPTTVVSSGQVGTSYTPATLLPSTTYRWRIIAINASGSTTGPVWSFTTAAIVTNGIKPDVVLDVELAGYGAGWTNLGKGGYEDVVSSAGLTIRRGIQGSGPDDNVAPSGNASFTLNNSADNSARKLGYYSPYNANKLAGWALDIRCRITLVDPATATPRVRFIGRIDAIDPVPGKKRERLVRVTAVGWLDEAARWTLTPAVGEQVGRTWKEILAAIIGAMPTPPVATSLDDGGEAYPFALDSSSFSTQSALAEFKKLADSERGLIYEKADGTFKAEGRHTRLLTTTSAWTLAETEYQGLSLPSTRDEVIDTIRVTVHPRVVDDAPTSIVYSQANVIEVAPSGSQILLGSFRDEVTGDAIGATDIQPLEPGTDYAANTLRDGSGVDITSDFSIVSTTGQAGVSSLVTNGNAATGYLLYLKRRGRAIKDKTPITLQSPQVSNGAHVVDLDMPYQSNADVGQGAADYYFAKYGAAFAQARSINVIGRTSALLSQILQRDISDRITIAETVTGVNNSFFINGEELRVLPSGHVSVSYTLAPAEDPLAGLYWVLGTSILGTDTIPAPF